MIISYDSRFESNLLPSHLRATARWFGPGLVDSAALLRASYAMRYPALISE
jgi:hypothetical protein